MQKAAFIGIGPRQDQPSPFKRGELVLYRPHQYRQLLQGGDVINLAPERWKQLFPLLRRCVSGHVRRCTWWPLLIEAQGIAIDVVSAKPLAPLPFPPFPRRCRPVCEGVVEVYQRICCWRPLIIHDPRIDEIIDILKRLPPVEVPPHFPPNPPDPPFFQTLALFKGGALDEAVLNGPRDRVALEGLSAAERVSYIEARPYLCRLLTCGTPSKVGQGFLQPDGAFQVCWRAFPLLLQPFCHFEVAYVVKQLIHGQTVTIYDGLAAHHWYSLAETPTLTSYNPKAVVCSGNEQPRLAGAVIYLDAIGHTDGFQLKTPNETGWDRVGAPAYNDGLAFPAASAAAAKGTYKNLNWGGTLNLRWVFSKECRAAGAKYYRASIIPADAAGNPLAGASRTYLGPPGGGWQKLVITTVAGQLQIDVVSITLGQRLIGGETNHHTIPYEADLASNEEWRDDQFHAQLPTTNHPEGRYLLSLEVFNAAGQRLRPNGAGGAGTDAPFQFKRWVATGSPDVFANVPYAGLTAMIWWDNRPGTGDIVALRKGTSITSGQSQFVSGTPTSSLAVDFIAHHPVEMFQLSHDITWYRGINGPSGSIPVAHPYDNEGAPPSTVATSNGVEFGTLLDGETKCSFAIHLNMSLKTYDGYSYLYPSTVREVAAFALSLDP